MKRLFRWLFPENKVWPYCTVKYGFPPWPDRDISHCGDVKWTYTTVVNKRRSK